MTKNRKELKIRMSKTKDPKEIEKVIREAEEDVGVKSDVEIEESKTTRGTPDMVDIAIKLGSAFIKAVVDKYGDRFVSWLSKKLKLDENTGEKVTAPPQ